MQAIPEINIPGEQKLTMFVRSRFIKVVSDDHFDVQMQYPILGMRHAESSCYVRKEVYEMLKKAVRNLPHGYRLRIWDAWRPFALQKELYEVYSREIIRGFALENHSEEEKKKMISRFVSAPIFDKNYPPVHTTGGAVDVTIIDDFGNELEMGTKFDAFSYLTHTAAFENEENQNVRENRRILYHIMTSAGFTNLPSEWWHYDYGDRFWAFYKSNPALYEGVFVKEEINE